MEPFRILDLGQKSSMESREARMSWCVLQYVTVVQKNYQSPIKELVESDPSAQRSLL